MRRTSSAETTAKARRPRELSVPAVQRLHIWRGASGRRYVHGVFRLVDCPEVESAAYVLVRRTADGRRKALRIDRTKSAAPSLNLAQIRQVAAQLGANEVHLHSLAQSETLRATIVFDLRAGLFGSLAAEAERVRPVASRAS
ncbi:MAG: hypothetical protein R3D57_14810 [Hyphomicrobiaceae bacterium]